MTDATISKLYEHVNEFMSELSPEQLQEVVMTPWVDLRTVLSSSKAQQPGYSNPDEAFAAGKDAGQLEGGASALRTAAQTFLDRLPDGTPNGRAYNSYAVGHMLQSRADELDGGSSDGSPHTIKA